MKGLITIFVITALFFSCEQTDKLPTFDNMDVKSGFVLNKEISLGLKECAGDTQTHTYICLDSIVSDSRCPTGVVCIWEGNAKARFKFAMRDDIPVFFDLNTFHGFTNDTTIGGYKFTLIDVYPYPGVKYILQKMDCRAVIKIEEESN